MGVVDRLETVQVDEQQGHTGTISHRLAYGAARLLDEQLPIRQSRQHVVVGQMLDSLLRPPSLRHVARRAVNPRRDPERSRRRGLALELDQPNLAPRVDDAMLETVAGRSTDGSPEVRLDPQEIVRVDKAEILTQGPRQFDVFSQPPISGRRPRQRAASCIPLPGRDAADAMCRSEEPRASGELRPAL
jgi:hypothetical protein